MTIQEVATKFSVSKDTLRYYEKEGLVGPVFKNDYGIRNYSEADLQRIAFIICMRSAEIPISVLKQYVDLYEQGADTKEERRLLLEQQRDVLAEKISQMQKAYDKLVYKIELYQDDKLDDYIGGKEI